MRSVLAVNSITTAHNSVFYTVHTFSYAFFGLFLKSSLSQLFSFVFVKIYFRYRNTKDVFYQQNFCSVKTHFVQSSTKKMSIVMHINCIILICVTWDLLIGFSSVMWARADGLRWTYRKMLLMRIPNNFWVWNCAIMKEDRQKKYWKTHRRKPRELQNKEKYKKRQNSAKDL